MSKNDGTPEVFGDGDVTIVMNGRQARMFVGSVQVEVLDGIKLEVGQDGNGVSLAVSFPKSHEEDVARRIEENARTVRAAPWIRVLQ